MIAARIIVLIFGYVLGLFPTGRLVGKSKNTDLTKEGSGNTGMTNSIRVLGWKPGITVFLGDCLKAVIAMLVVWLICRRIFPDAVNLLRLYAAAGVILGHDFPVYAKFKGGKGIASSVGTIISFDWRMIPICTAAFFIAVIPTGIMSIGSLMILSGFFVQTIVFGQLGMIHNVPVNLLPELYILAGFITGLAFFRHKENLKRLAHGEENKFAPKKKKSSEEKETV